MPILDTNNQVILVDLDDKPFGTADKMQAHRKGWLHRAFSVFLFREKNNQLELLLQQRAFDKYHSGGLWTNTCCSHPRPEEKTLDAAKRRLQEEMGIKAELKCIGQFHYCKTVTNDLTENELDHVFVGMLEQNSFQINPAEVADYRWVSLATLEQELKQQPHQFTAWLAQAFAIIKQYSTKLPAILQEKSCNTYQIKH
jgi:isopentenyl-diphosphate delta-isomerase type 1